MADFASEAGHWYKRDGEPNYTIIGRNGIERQATLRDARKLDLLPGVTTIIRCAAAPGLEVWKQQQVLLAALTLPRLEGEVEKDWLARVMADSKEEASKAAERGTEVHAAIERYYRHESYPRELVEHVEATVAEVTKHCGAQNWRAERSYAHRFGYGCKLDLHSDNFVIDHKGKDGAAYPELALYDEHLMQLAAQRLAAGIPRARCFINFFGRSDPWSKMIEASEEDLQRGWDMFESLLTYWTAKNKFYPEE